MLNEFATLRVRAGLSLEDAAGLTGYSVRQLQRWEAGVGKPRDAAARVLASMAGTEPAPLDTRFNFIDLFAGMGGFTVGAVNAGATCIVAVDNWDESCAVHRANHPTIPVTRMVLGHPDHSIPWITLVSFVPRHPWPWNKRDVLYPVP